MFFSRNIFWTMNFILFGFSVINLRKLKVSVSKEVNTQMNSNSNSSQFVPQFPLLSFKTQPFSPALIAAPFHPGADVVVKSPSHFLHFPFSVLLFLVRFYFSLLLLAFYVVVTKSPFHFLHLPTWRAPLSMLVMSISFHNSTFFSRKVIEKLFLCIWGWQSFRICFVSLRLLFKENVLIFQAFGGIRFWGNLPRHFLQGLAAVSLKARSWRDFWMRASRLFPNCKILPPQYSYKICISSTIFLWNIADDSWSISYAIFNDFYWMLLIFMCYSVLQ